MLQKSSTLPAASDKLQGYYLIIGPRLVLKLLAARLPPIVGTEAVLGCRSCWRSFLFRHILEALGVRQPAFPISCFTRWNAACNSRNWTHRILHVRIVLCNLPLLPCTVGWDRSWTPLHSQRISNLSSDLYCQCLSSAAHAAAAITQGSVGKVTVVGMTAAGFHI